MVAVAEVIGNWPVAGLSWVTAREPTTVPVVPLVRMGIDARRCQPVVVTWAAEVAIVG
jgi:hypothetical protein